MFHHFFMSFIISSVLWNSTGSLTKPNNGQEESPPICKGWADHATLALFQVFSPEREQYESDLSYIRSQNVHVCFHLREKWCESYFLACNLERWLYNLLNRSELLIGHKNHNFTPLKHKNSFMFTCKTSQFVMYSLHLSWFILIKVLFIHW